MIKEMQQLHHSNALIYLVQHHVCNEPKGSTVMCCHTNNPICTFGQNGFNKQQCSASFKAKEVSSIAKYARDLLLYTL